MFLGPNILRFPPNTNEYSNIYSVLYFQNCYELIIQAICGDENTVFSGGYDNKVKGWTNLEQAIPTPLGEVEVGSCVNALVCSTLKRVYIATADGFVRKAKFV